MIKQWRVRDAVHNFVSLQSDEVKLLDCPGLQRLRNVRQLAMASLVYPGALHTRFDHTIGVVHVAKQMCEALGIKQDRQKQVVRACFLHDVGHGPFSHVSESVLNELAPENLKKAKKKEKIHELVTKKIILEDLCETHIEDVDREQVVSLLNEEDFGDRVLRQIVSGPLDADKQDYLLRDSLYCGVPYGRYDIHQLHRSLDVHKEGGDEETLVVKDEGIGTLEQFALAKYSMTLQVYRHKGRMISDQMIVRALLLSVREDEIDELAQLFTYQNTKGWHRDYLTWDDARLIDFMRRLREDDPTKKGPHLFCRLLSRKLLKSVVRITEQELPDDIKGYAVDAAKKNRDALESWATEEINGLLRARGNVGRHEVILHTYRVDSLGTMVNNDDTVLVQGKQPVPLVERSVLFRSIDASRHNQGMILMAALPEMPPDAKRKLQAEMQKRLFDKLRSFAPQAQAALSPEVTSPTP